MTRAVIVLALLAAAHAASAQSGASLADQPGASATPSATAQSPTANMPRGTRGAQVAMTAAEPNAAGGASATPETQPTATNSTPGAQRSTTPGTVGAQATKTPSGAADGQAATTPSGTADAQAATTPSGTANAQAATTPSGAADAQATTPPSGAADAQAASPPAAPPPPEGTDAIVEQPRPFGYVLGDTLTQQVSISPDFQPENLPPLERANLWFARHSSKLQTRDDKSRWLVMEYQIVNAPQALMTVNLPTVTLKSKTGGVLTVQPWTISIGPLTPHTVFAKGGLQTLRPDHPAPMVETSTLQRQMEAWLTAFAVTVAAWITWWAIRSIRANANQPFARALREVRQLGEDNADAWLAIHRAFDRTAGRALQTSTLPTLFKQAPHFEPERTAIEQFYAQSNLRFFGSAPANAQPPSGAADNAYRAGANRSAAPPIATRTSPLELRALAATLRRIEKQHEH